MAHQHTPAATHPRLLTRGPVRWWAIGSVLAVALVVLATVSGRFLATQARQAANSMPAPTYPPLSVVALAASPPGLRTQAVAVADGRVAALFTSDAPPCPPTVACPSPARAGQLDVLDGATGHVLARQSLPPTDAALAARWLLADPAARRVYAISPGNVAVFSLDDARTLAEWPLSEAGATGATLAGQGRLAIATHGALLLLDTASGQVMTRYALPTNGAVSLVGPVYDASADVLALLSSRTGGAPTLLRVVVPALQSLPPITLPAGMTLGPADPHGGVLLYGAEGRIWWLDVTDTSAPATSAPPQLTELPALRGAHALGWDTAQGRTLAALPDRLLTLSTQDTTREAAPLAGLPFSVAWPAEQPLAIDSARGLLALPAGADGVLIARDTPPSQPTPLDTTITSLLARTALARLLPPPSQQPPFFRATDLPIAASARQWNFWVHSGDLGWLGPFTGTLTTSISPETGHPGAYTVTYEVAWQQLFQHTHTWSVAVAPDGAVRLTAERGDALP